ncbi:MAG: hypothetical protein K2L22_03720 [Muribaculaceae bacterium]|nr:hypothetical protein [Muribaculaceae bacterium]
MEESLPRLPLEVLHKKYPPIKGKNGIYWSNCTIIGKNGMGGVIFSTNLLHMKKNCSNFASSREERVWFEIIGIAFYFS